MKKIFILLFSLFVFQSLINAMNFSGTYYVGPAGSKPGGGDPDFLTFKACLDSISKGTFSGNSIFYITGDLTEPTSVGVACNPGAFTVTIKPYTGLTPTITILYPTDANSGPSGAFIIGIPATNNIAWADLAVTRNLIIDGSNTAGGTTRDLTFTTASTSHRNAINFVIVGDVANVTLKNCKVQYKTQVVTTSGNLFIGTIMIRAYNNGTTEWVPKDLTIENNHLNANYPGGPRNVQGLGSYQSGTATTTFPSNITVKGNLIEGKARGIGLYKTSGWNIEGNEIIANQDIVNDTQVDGIAAVDVAAGAVVTITKNKITKVFGRDSVGAGNVVTGIRIESNGTYHVNNNFISGLSFSFLGGTPSANAYGIRTTSASATNNIYFNTILVDSLPTVAGTINTAGFYFSNGTSNFSNNIVKVLAKTYSGFGILRAGTTGTLASDYNDIFAPGDSAHVGFFNGVTTPGISDWQTASAGDAHSVGVDPGLVSGTDLHLLSSGSPVVGKGIAIAGITTDIDGQNRKTVPDIGADETLSAVPVELVSFSAKRSGTSVVLSWKTATELNNKGFVVERKVRGNWTEVGFVAGSGTTASLHEYLFTDASVDGKQVYRLKQVDFNGSYQYSFEIAVDAVKAQTFALDQNYPNPFNPSTTIRFSIPQDVHVRLDVYSISGELITTLVNEARTAGEYRVPFNGAGLASGIYFYKLTAGTQTLINKMNLLK